MFKIGIYFDGQIPSKPSNTNKMADNVVCESKNASQK